MNWKKNMPALDPNLWDDTILEDYETGDRTPRNVPYYRNKKIADGVWQVLGNGDFVYLIEGDDEILCVDSGMGCGNVREYCQSIVPDKPLYRVLTTHSHGDHIVNNYLFDVAYMSKRTYDDIHNRPMKMGPDTPDDYPVVFIKEGDVINLKGRPLEVIGVEDHAMGSLQFLDRKSRILFSGDEFNGFFYNSNFTVEYSYSQTSKLMKYRDAFDIFCAGNGIWPGEFLDKSHAGIKYILDGHADEGKELYTAYLDPMSTIKELDGKRVIARRSPDFERLVQPLRDAGYGEWVDRLDGNAGFPLMRKLTKDGPWDRELLWDGIRIMYYRNHIWGKPEEK